MVSFVITGNLVSALRGKDEFLSGDHFLLMGVGTYEIRQWYLEETEMVLGEARDPASMEEACRMERIMWTGAWLSVLPSTTNENKLGAQECRDSLFLRYGINPPDLPEHCDGCGAAFDICHALGCKKGGLIMARHNGLRDGVTELASKAFAPTHVAPCGEWIKSSKGTFKKSKKKIWRGISSSETSGLRGRTLFKTCVSWILTPLPIRTKTPRSAWKLLKRKRKRSILVPDSNIIRNLLPLLSQRKFFSGSMRRRHWNVPPTASQLSGRNPTHIPADKWRVGLQ